MHTATRTLHAPSQVAQHAARVYRFDHSRRAWRQLSPVDAPGVECDAANDEVGDKSDEVGDKNDEVEDKGEPAKCTRRHTRRPEAVTSRLSLLLLCLCPLPVLCCSSRPRRRPPPPAARRPPSAPPHKATLLTQGTCSTRRPPCSSSLRIPLAASCRARSDVGKRTIWSVLVPCTSTTPERDSSTATTLISTLHAGLHKTLTSALGNAPERLDWANTRPLEQQDVICKSHAQGTSFPTPRYLRTHPVHRAEGPPAHKPSPAREGDDLRAGAGPTSSQQPETIPGRVRMRTCCQDASPALCVLGFHR